LIFLSRIKNTLTRVVPIVLGLAAAVGGWLYLQSYLETHKDMVSLPVAARDIAPYTTITGDDITYKEFIAGSEQADAITDPREAIGKITTAALQKGWQINKKVLASKDIYGNQRQIGVNVDAARAAGVKPGDLVDVYWLLPETGVWTGKTAALVAENVRVIAVCDQKGARLDRDNNKQMVTPTSNEPRVVYLLVKPEDVDKVIGGSGPKNASIALAVKRKEDTIAPKTALPAEPAAAPKESPGTAANTGKTANPR
jgi:pilus assembly protein CpaB